MELELEGGPAVEVSGNVEVTLPDYMTMLPQEELNEARRAVQRDKVIIAAGRRPEDTDEVVILTATNRLMVLRVAQYGVPDGKVIPINWGHSLAVEGYYEMAADWAIANAEPIDVAFHVPTYEGENDSR